MSSKNAATPKFTSTKRLAKALNVHITTIGQLRIQLGLSDEEAPNLGSPMGYFYSDAAVAKIKMQIAENTKKRIESATANAAKAREATAAKRAAKAAAKEAERKPSILDKARAAGEAARAAEADLPKRPQATPNDSAILDLMAEQFAGIDKQLLNVAARIVSLSGHVSVNNGSVQGLVRTVGSTEFGLLNSTVTRLSSRMGVLEKLLESLPEHLAAHESKLNLALNYMRRAEARSLGPVEPTTVAEGPAPVSEQPVDVLSTSAA